MAEVPAQTQTDTQVKEPTQAKVQALNPFAKRESHSSRSLGIYKILTIASWLLLVFISVTHTFSAPAGRQNPHSHRNAKTIWGQNRANPTPFKLNSLLTSIYWIVLFTFQIGYVTRLFSSHAESVTAAANVGSHFIFHNLLTFAHVMLWTRGDFWWGELVLAINFFNLSSLYFRHSKTPQFVHIPAVAGPFAWIFIALLWDGAAMVNAHGFFARVTANVFIWSLLIIGMFFLAVFRDYTMGFCLAYLTTCLAVGQMTTKVVALQWIFAWVIAGVLFVSTIMIAAPGLLGVKVQESIEEARGAIEDRERQPLLGGNQ